jgi:hypothetical protein
MNHDKNPEPGESTKPSPKAPKIGQRQANRLCQMSPAGRLAFIAEGLPIILTSAQGFWHASAALTGSPREAEVLRGFAKEEAAKILVLMDLVRCPTALLDDRLGTLVTRFYGHLDRLIYAQVAEWWAEDIVRLRASIEPLRKTHYLEGNIGEYILPNSTLYDRESKLYADIEAYEDGAPLWNAPTVHSSGFPAWKPPVLAVAEAMSALGMFTSAGLKAVAEIWETTAFTGTESLRDSERLMEQLVGRLVAERLPSEQATQDHVGCLYRSWPLPLYDVDLKPIPVTIKELKQEQERLYWAEVDDPYDDPW